MKDPKKKLELGSIIDADFILNNILKSKKGIPTQRINGGYIDRGPMTISLLFVGTEGSGVSRLISYLMKNYPYTNDHTLNYGRAPTATCSWYKQHCYAFQTCRDIHEYTPCFTKKFKTSTIVLVLDCYRKEENILNQTLELFSNILSGKNSDRPNSLMVLAHKQDLIDCFSIKELQEKLSKFKEIFVNYVNYAIMPTSIKFNNRCIETVMDWLYGYSYKFDTSLYRKRLTLPFDHDLDCID